MMKKALAAAAGLVWMAAAGAYRVPEIAEVEERLDGAIAAGHPRVIFNAADFRRVAARAKGGDEWFRGVAEAVRRDADLALGKKPVQSNLTGFRMLSHSRDALQRISALAMAYRIWGDEKHLQGAVENLRNVAGFETWNPRHFLDVGEMALAVAIGYDWLYDWLEPEVRGELERAMIGKGLAPGREETGGVKKYLWWANGDNNWSQVCHAGLVCAGLAVADKVKGEAAFMVRRAVEKLPRAMAVYAPKGAYPEGPGYWSYGTLFNVVALQAMETALGTDWGLSELPGFAETVNYQNLMMGNSGLFFNYADGSSWWMHDSAVWWLARKFGRGDVLGLNAVGVLGRSVERSKGAKGSGDRLFALTLGFLPEEKPVAGEGALPNLWTAGAREDVGVQRSGGKGGGEWFAAFKAGSPKQNHAHMDSGSFVLDRFGERWVFDLGHENYHKIESRGMTLWDMGQESDRWKVYRLSNFAHNLVVVDGALHDVKGCGKIVEARETGGGGSVLEIDVGSLHLGVGGMVRRSEMLAGDAGLAVTDRIKGMKAGSRARWQMMVEKGAVAEGRRLTMRKKGKTVTAVAPEGVEWGLLEGPKPNEWDSANGNYAQAWFEVGAPGEGGDLEIAVRFE